MTDDAPRMVPAPGVEVDGLVLETRVATGSSGEVWRARRGVEAERVAIKFLDPKRHELGQREHQLLDALEHPSLVKVIAHGAGWVATEWVEGRTLGHLLETEGPLSVERTARMLGGIAEALDHLATAGITHGDVSPSNIVVDVSDRAVLIDLGLARPVDPERTADEGVLGTPRYMAPEVIRGEADAGRADQYSLALIAYEAVTGGWPFPETGQAMAVLQHHLATQPAAASEHVPTLSPLTVAGLARGLAKNPSERHATARGLIDSLLPIRDAQRGGPQGGRSRVGRRTVAAVLGGVVAVGAGALVLARGDSAAGPADLVESGCNLLGATTFDDGQVIDQFYAGDDVDLGVIAPGDGRDGSAALRLGDVETAGLYGELVEVEPGTDYRFAVNVLDTGEGASRLRVTFLDDGVVPIGDEADDPTVEVSSGQTGFVELDAAAPADAAFAVPSVLVEPGGAVLVDDLLFAASGCAP